MKTRGNRTENILALFTLVLLWHFLLNAPADFVAWRAWVIQPWVSIGLFLFIAALVLHAWVGIRDVLIDYVHPLGIRITLLTLLSTSIAG